MKLKDKCGFHFAIVLLLPSKERIMLRIWKLKKNYAPCVIIDHRTLKITKLGRSLAAS
jgi:hypothetical protein